ncbi:glutamine synthetase family protein [Neolewinella agarilytica]|uniref:Glutamine synthetase n=1 Tax=Neolewinella agarilytica TaxID=478744 RepID=A0A1H9NMD7_9BACT|nr:glutamine synthetase [Neolewinella agarilytica]SER37062.1 glutamine synthetase [Neolewinella agarilytica]
MQNLLPWLKAQTHDHLKIGLTDLDGVLRAKYLSRKKVLSGLEKGLGFCNVVFQWDIGDALYGNGLAEAGFADGPAAYAAGTQRNIPWEDNLPFLLADFHGAPAGPAARGCPRSLLRRVIAKAEAMGFSARFGPEYEWFAYRETPAELAAKDYQNARPLTPGMFGYSGLRTSQNGDYFKDLFTQLTAFGVELEGLHTETGPGALEAAIAHQPALEAADRAVLFKQGVKEISYQHGIVASFMAKPSADLPGCGGHLHQSLWRGEENIFHDSQSPDGISQTMLHYLSGQLTLLPEILPLFAPTVNSYKRYVAGSWAATRANWGIDNRTVALRAIPGGGSATRLETRVPGADANPYLVMAAALAAGLYGIEHELEAPAPVAGSAYEQTIGVVLPTDLGAAAGAMKNSEKARACFGDDFCAHFVRSREWEWQQYQRAVTDWERSRYFELV